MARRKGTWVDMIEIKGLQKMSLIDYPGKISAVVFLAKCNFRCPYCHNPELVVGFDRLPSIGQEELFKFLQEREKWIDGVVITGGEPCIQPELPEFAKRIKGLGFLVKLDTNGSNPRMLESMVKGKLVDFISMDIKGPLAKYREIARVDVNEKDIQKSVDIIRSSGLDYEFRTTAVPGIIGKKDIMEMGKWLKGSERYCIQQFRPLKTLDRKCQKVKPYTKEELDGFADSVKGFFKSVEVRD